MESVLHAAAIYMTLTVVFRIAGRRLLSQITTFDFVLLILISEATQNAMVGNDNSLTNAILVILTLIVLDIIMASWKQRSPEIERFFDGVPLIIVENGKPLYNRIKKARVSEGDILAAARKLHGLERMEQIKYAVLESNGGISIISKPPSECQNELLNRD